MNYILTYDISLSLIHIYSAIGALDRYLPIYLIALILLFKSFLATSKKNLVSVSYTHLIDYL